MQHYNLIIPPMSRKPVNIDALRSAYILGENIEFIKIYKMFVFRIITLNTCINHGIPLLYRCIYYMMYN